MYNFGFIDSPSMQVGGVTEQTITMLKKLLTLVAFFATITLTANAQTASSAVDGKKQTLFSSVNHASTPYRIPAIATLKNGTVFAIADQRPCGADIGNGEVDIYAKVGTIAADGSYNWNPSAIDPSVSGGLKIADGTSSYGYGDAAVVVDRESGKVLVICVAGNVKFASGSSSKHNKMARIVGSADGLSWETPQDVTSKFFANELSDAYTMFMASGKMIQSRSVKNGEYYRIYGALLVREKKSIFSAVTKNYVVYSDDFGVTWNVLGGTAAVTSDADEAKVEELPNGDIVLSSRTSGGRYYNVFNSASGSWGSATTYSFGGSNSTNGELMLYKGLVDKNGTAYNVMLQSLPTGSDRSKVAVFYKAFATNKTSWAVSDFTSGWTKGIEVDNGASAYSTMTILPNGQVGFLYEDDYDTDKADGDYSNIVYVPLTVEEITNNAFSHVDATAPTFSHNGEVTEGTQVTISAEEGTTIHYTTDGSAPSRVSAKYSGAITVNSEMTIKAIAIKDCDYTYSAVATANFTIKAPAVKVATPTFSPNGGEVEEGTAVEITCATEGAAIYYTTDGTTPTASSAVYSGAITVNKAMTIKAIAAKEGNYTNSEVVSAAFTIKAREVVKTPVFNPAGGDYYEPVTVAISCATDGAAVYYTTEGTTPTTSSTKYSGAITISSTTTLKAIAAKEGYYTNSAVAEATYRIIAKDVVATPTFSHNSGEVEEGTKVTISCATEGAAIYYTTDGTTPATSSAVYDGAITVNSAMTIKAIAAKEGNYINSEVVSVTFTIKPREVVATPVINPAGGEVEAGTAVTITCATNEAKIYYTTDGTEPTTGSTLYTGSITVNDEITIKAIAVKDGYYTDSEVATASFTIKEVVVEPEVTEYTVTPVSGLIGRTTYYIATFSANENTVAPVGVSVFYVKSVSSDEVALSRVSSGKTIPAGEGVVLVTGSASAFNMTSTTDESNVADLSDNCLAGTGDGIDFTFDTENCYALAVKGTGELAGQFAFCKVAVGTTINGYNNRAYLDLSASGVSFSNNVRVSFDGTTGVESVVDEYADDVIYDLYGHRVHEMKPGNIYIINGKKVLKK